MKKTLIFSAMIAISASSWSQTAVIKGKFHKLLPNGKETQEVFFSKPEDGEIEVILPMVKSRQDQIFRGEVKKEDLNTIRYVGVFDEQYAVYLKAGEELNVDAGDGQIVYSGTINKENQVFADWYKMIKPLRNYGYTKNGYTLPSDGYLRIIDSLKAPVEQFIKNINTGNTAFDKQAKHFLTYSYRYDVIIPTASGLNIGKKDEYPESLVKFYNDEKWTDANIWNLPMGYHYMLYFAFVKHIIYNSKQGMAADILIPEISNKELKAKFIVAQAERGANMNLVQYLERNEQYMQTNQQRDKMKVMLKRARMQEPGGDWIDFSYPDAAGKMHKLSDNLGKVVFIDVWATWCAPCLKEQPALEELEKSFAGKDVVFLSLSIDTDKAKWQKMVEEKKLSGLHLFTNNKGSVVSDYEVTEIPRFILFDKNGKTVSIDAPRPTDAKLKALIESTLKGEKSTTK
ncbi:TlpA disulfide reductase family protein [Pedobacter sp. PF22-3]|uniref:TlpA family protein disulfide reductase n=1 Tax=Pedobacter sp. PF22-3 TaxID=2994467 RepID=UPI002246E3D2|nr:TlpA disulfide reductase family protein [Pedobacter sp. PF22-3]MCX2494652.1 TlpA disulfide reductase family protein [Pedobacter sp. PF22-3]